MLPMKAIRAHSFGGPDVLQLDDLPEPSPGAGQVRVRLHAAGVNPYDTYMLSGTYAIKPPLPYSPGADGAGVVEAVGDGVSGVRVGDRVYTGGTADHKSYGAYRQVVMCSALPGASAAGAPQLRRRRGRERAVRDRLPGPAAGRAERPATRCWCTAPAAPSAWPRCSWPGPPD